MRKIVSIICALILALLFPAALMVSHGLPADTRAHVSKKYAGWNGVLQAWVCCEWEPGGSFISWLNGCAAEFEKAHEGLYVEFISVGKSEMRAMLGGGMRAPEMILFSPGVLESADGLQELTMPANLRPDLSFCGEGYACPVALGGYILVNMRSMQDANTLALPPDDAAHNYSAAAAGLMSGSAETEIETQQPGLDLGLPANAQAVLLHRADALDAFINGEIGQTIVNQAGLARLKRLQDNGRGPDWECRAAGSYAYTDQLLMLALPRLSGADAGERSELAGNFLTHLLSESSQAALSRAGACSVSGARVHSDFSVYAELDALLCSLPLAAADCFSEYSPADAEAIVRRPLSGQCSSSPRWS